MQFNGRLKHTPPVCPKLPCANTKDAKIEDDRVAYDVTKETKKRTADGEGKPPVNRVQVRLNRVM